MANGPTQTISVEAQAHLDGIYHAARATDTAAKIGVLNSKLGGTTNFYAVGGCVTDEMKLACLELEYLESQGLIELV